jgi:hypothetical protein
LAERPERNLASLRRRFSVSHHFLIAGDDATKALVMMHTMDLTVDNSCGAGRNGPVSTTPIGADDLFMDWAVTNYVLDGIGSRWTLHLS